MASPTSGDLPMRFLISNLILDEDAALLQLPARSLRGLLSRRSRRLRNARLAMPPYKLAALDCNIARINLEYDVMRANLSAPACLTQLARAETTLRRARMRDAASWQRCQRLMADLELGSACGRPDVAAYAAQLSVEMRRSDR
jgi:hypothetical protein